MTKRNVTWKWLSETLAGVSAAILCSVTLTGCFTGIESTPRITYKDVKKEDIHTTPEQLIGSEITAEPFSRWIPGRRFLVTDDRGALSYTLPGGSDFTLRKGDTLVYAGAHDVRSIIGDNTAELLFTVISAHGAETADTLRYRPGGDLAKLTSGGDILTPYIVDLDMVAKVDSMLRNRTFYTRTGRWLDRNGHIIAGGRKFLKVRITGVSACDENYPFLVSFISEEEGAEAGSLLMSVTPPEGVPSLRGFSDLFLVADPRSGYPMITDENWELIRRGRVVAGMTTREASLALGAPKDVDRRTDQSMLYERWRYPDGVYLIFEDGVLTRFNQ